MGAGDGAGTWRWGVGEGVSGRDGDRGQYWQGWRRDEDAAAVAIQKNFAAWLHEDERRSAPLAPMASRSRARQADCGADACQ